MSKYFFGASFFFEKRSDVGFPYRFSAAGGRSAKTPSKFSRLAPGGAHLISDTKNPIPIVYAYGTSSGRALAETPFLHRYIYSVSLWHGPWSSARRNPPFLHTPPTYRNLTSAKTFSKTIGQNFSRPSPENRKGNQHAMLKIRPNIQVPPTDRPRSNPKNQSL